MKYENEVEKPAEPKQGSMERGMGCHEFKGQAMDQAYGQSGKKGCEKDYRKIESQMPETYSDSNSGY